MKRLVSLSVCLLALVAALAAQAAEAEESVEAAPPVRQVRVLLVLEREGGDREAWVRGLSIALARSPHVSAVLRAPAKDRAYDEALSQDCALVLEVEGRSTASGEARVIWRYADSLTRELLAQGDYRAPEPTERDLSGFLWDGALEGLSIAAPKVRLTKFLLRGPPGARVSGFSPRPLVIGDSGELEVVADAPVTYRWRAEIRDSYPLSGAFAFLGAPDTVLSLRTEPLPRYSYDLGLIMGQFLTLRWDWRLLQDYASAGFTFNNFWPGLRLVEAFDPADRPSPFVFLPLVQPGLRLGLYLKPPEALFRPYLSLEAFLRLIFPDFRELRLDPLAAWGLLPTLGMEYGPSQAFRVWAELGPHWYPVAKGELVAASNPGATWFYTGSMAMELPALRFGLRFML